MVWSVTAIAGVSLAIWLYLVALRGGFWRADRAAAYIEATQLAGFGEAEAHKFFGRPRGLDRPEHPHLEALPPGAAKARYLERFKTLTLGARR